MWWIEEGGVIGGEASHNSFKRENTKVDMKLLNGPMSFVYGGCLGGKVIQLKLLRRLGAQPARDGLHPFFYLLEPCC